jgi:hypothetical protein
LLILGVDPGLESPGFAVWSVVHGQHVYYAAEPPPYPCDVVVVESGWPHGPMGKVQMWGLGFRACMQLLSAPLTANGARHTIKPKAWRAALGGLPANAPKAVIVARLRQIRYRDVPGIADVSDDIIEARGIAEATAILLARKFKKDRQGLVEVKR